MQSCLKKVKKEKSTPRGMIDGRPWRDDRHPSPSQSSSAAELLDTSSLLQAQHLLPL